MGIRVRSVNKIGKGTYLTSSWKLTDYFWGMLFYYIIIFPFYIIFKYCIYYPFKLFWKYCIVYPIRWIITKIKDLINSSK